MKPLTDAEMRERFARGWSSGRHEGTPCGLGSTLPATARVRAWLPLIAERYAIRTVCDAGAGDLHWMQRVRWSVDYRPFDLIVRHPSVTEIDITTERLPDCDLILCRQVLNHLEPERIERALALFRQAGKYLAATQYSVPDLTPRDYVHYDLRAFGLGEPIESVGELDGELALWTL